MTNKDDLQEAYIQGYQQGNGGVWSDIKEKTATRLFERWYSLNWGEHDG